MTDIRQAILAPLVYYDLLDRPLTAIEVFKYLRADGPEISFFGLREFLKSTRLVSRQNGLHFLPGREKILKVRQKRLKLAQLKWRKLENIGRCLVLAPFLRLAAVTGSLTSFNSRETSDLDLLIVITKDRLWLGRFLLTGLISVLGRRRHGALTRDRVCLNCYLTEEKLEITREAKPRDWHAAQEYGRLTPLLENQTGTYDKMVQANAWLNGFLKNYPWPNACHAKKINPPHVFTAPRRLLEWLLGGPMGESLEKIAAIKQKQRIAKKRRAEANDETDQIFVSDHCLMFHPRSKSDKLTKDFDRKISAFNDGV